MKYLLIVSIVINIILGMKILAMRISIKELRVDFAERAELRSNTLIGVSSRDKQIRLLVSSINDTLVKLRDAFNKYKLGFFLLEPSWGIAERAKHNARGNFCYKLVI